MKGKLLIIFISIFVLFLIPIINSQTPIVNIPLEEDGEKVIGNFPIIKIPVAKVTTTQITDTNATTACSGSQVLLGNGSCGTTGGGGSANETNRLQNITDYDCVSGEFVNGFQLNGTVICGIDTGGTNTWELNLTDGVSDNLNPFIDKIQSLGTSIKRWLNLHVDNIFVTDINITGDLFSPTIYDVSTQGLVLAMNFNNESIKGTIVLDSSGKNNHGTNNGATYNATGGFDNLGSGAFQFDGVNDFINIDTTQTALASTTQGTWIAWVKPIDATPLTSEEFIAFGDTNANEFIHIIIFPSGKFSAFARNTVESKFSLQTDSAVFLDNTWVHVALVQNGVSPVIYIDGVVVAQTFITSTDTTYWFSDSIVIDNGRIGDVNRNNDGETLHFNGTIDEVGIYDRALSSDEIKRLYLQRNEFHDSYVSQNDVFVDSLGNVGIGTTTPTSTLEVNGNVTIAENLTVAGNITANDNIFATNRIGIGTNTPTNELDVLGSINVSDRVFFKDIRTGILRNGVDLFIESQDDIQIRPDQDIFIEVGSTQYAVFDGGQKSFGIGTGLVAERATLEVGGNVTISNNLTVEGNITSNDRVIARFFEGLFSWIVNVSSSPYLNFNESTLSFDEVKLNATITDLSTGAANETVRLQNITTYPCSSGEFVTGFQLNATVICSGLTWEEITLSTKTVVVNERYIANNESRVNFTLPTTASVGDTFRISGKSSSGWRILQGVDQQIHNGFFSTVAGISDGLRSTNQRDSVELVCVVADKEWNVVSKIGEPTLLFKNNKSILFDGSAEALNIDDVLTNQLQTTTKGTLSAWIKPTDASPSGAPMIVTFGDTNADTYISWFLDPPLGLLRANLVSTSSVKWDMETAVTLAPDATWVHVVLVHDGISPRFYINGFPKAFIFTAGGDRSQWFNNIAGLDNGRIGARNKASAGNANFWSGNIDEVALFNDALTSGEIEELYNSGTPKNPLTHSQNANLVAYFQMGDGSDSETTIIDHAKANNATGINLEAGDLVEDIP